MLEEALQKEASLGEPEHCVVTISRPEDPGSSFRQGVHSRGSHVLVDQRGHDQSTRRLDVLSRAAFVGDLLAVMDAFAQGEKCTLVGQLMGAHAAFLTSALHPDRVESLLILEGNVAGSSDSEKVAALRHWFRLVADIVS